MTEATYSLHFHRSNTYTGTPEQILRQLSKHQWDEEGKRNVKRSLAWRAWVLTRTPVDEDADDLAFLRAFAATGLATLEVNG